MAAQKQGGTSKAKVSTTKTDAADVKKAKAAAGKVVQSAATKNAAKLAAEYAWLKTTGYNGVGSNFYTPPEKKGKGGKSGKGNKNPEAGPAKVNPAIVTSSAIGGQINPNVFEAYIAEIKRLTLKLVNSSKDLLLAYDFQSINSAVDYYLDTDNASKTYATLVRKAVPAPNFSPNQLSVQELTNNLVNTLAEYLSDTIEDNIRFNYFGSYVEGRWDPGTVTFSGNQPKYDLKVSIPVNSQIKNIQVSLYEI